jgi:hypothetical protein
MAEQQGKLEIRELDARPRIRVQNSGSRNPPISGAMGSSI